MPIHALVRLIAAILLSGILHACATQSDVQRHLDDTLRAYERALRWEGLDKAASFQKNPQTIGDRERRRLKHIQITAYNILSASYTPTRATQLVEIRYYNDLNVVERTYTDRQTWEYDKGRQRWYLVSALPRLK
jgi:hypothetical protein